MESEAGDGAVPHGAPPGRVGHAWDTTIIDYFSIYCQHSHSTEPDHTRRLTCGYDVEDTRLVGFLVSHLRKDVTHWLSDYPFDQEC